MLTVTIKEMTAAAIWAIKIRVDHAVFFIIPHYQKGGDRSCSGHPTFLNFFKSQLRKKFRIEILCHGAASSGSAHILHNGDQRNHQDILVDDSRNIGACGIIGDVSNIGKYPAELGKKALCVISKGGYTRQGTQIETSFAKAGVKQ